MSLAWASGLPTSPLVRRFGKYSLVSALNVVLGVCILSFGFGVLGWSARSANLVGTAVVTPLSFLLNRAWVWGRTGRSHLLGEVVPFWAIAFLGLGLSTWTAGHAEALAAHVTSARAAQTLIVTALTIVPFAVLWVGRFVLLESVLFARRPGPAPSEKVADALV